MSALLPRVLPTSVETSFDESVRDLAVKANGLGYSVLKEKIASEEVYTALLRRLHQLEIVPFDAEAVKRYKSEKQLALQYGGRKWLSKLAFLDVRDGPPPLGALSIVSTIASILLIILWATEHVSGFTVTCVLCGCLPLAFAAGYAQVLLSKYLEYKAEWDSDSISNYSRPIPLYALETAARLKEAFGEEVNIRVEHLSLKKIHRPDPDPFLVGRFNKAYDFAFEVWDEPDFRAKRKY